MKDDRSSPGFYIRVGPPAPGAGGRADRVKLLDETTKVLSLKFEDDELKPDKLTLVVDNYDLRHLDSDTWARGNVIEFQYGYQGRMSPPRTAVVQSVKGFNRLTIEAQSPDTLMDRQARPERVFKQMKRSDVVREIVKSYGYSDDQLRIDDTGDVLEQVTQGPFTDYQLVRQLAWKEGFEFWVDFDGVHFKKRPTDGAPVKTYRWFVEQGRGELLSVNLEDDISPARQKVGAVTMRGRDPDTGKAFEVRADNASTSSRTTLMPTLSVHEAELTDQAQRHNEVNGCELVMPTTATNEADAQKQADAHFVKLQMRAVKLALGAVGDPGVTAKAIIRLDGIGRRYSGLYYVRNATHEVNPNGYTMSLKASTDGHGTGSVGAGGAPATGPAAQGNPNPNANARP